MTIMTMHASKGLESPIVEIAGLRLMRYRPYPAVDDVRRLYVAMTRDRDSGDGRQSQPRFLRTPDGSWACGVSATQGNQLSP